jgi:hypothetical protein
LSRAAAHAAHGADEIVVVEQSAELLDDQSKDQDQ